MPYINKKKETNRVPKKRPIARLDLSNVSDLDRPDHILDWLEKRRGTKDLSGVFINVRKPRKRDKEEEIANRTPYLKNTAKLVQSRETLEEREGVYRKDKITYVDGTVKIVEKIGGIWVDHF